MHGISPSPSWGLHGTKNLPGILASGCIHNSYHGDRTDCIFLEKLEIGLIKRPDVFPGAWALDYGRDGVFLCLSLEQLKSKKYPLEIQSTTTLPLYFLSKVPIS